MTERLKRSLISKLRRFVRDDVNQWDKMLPYVLFAYRETPYPAIGFSPFELLYGTNPRGGGVRCFEEKSWGNYEEMKKP